MSGNRSVVERIRGRPRRSCDTRPRQVWIAPAPRPRSVRGRREHRCAACSASLPRPEPGSHKRRHIPLGHVPADNLRQRRAVFAGMNSRARRSLPPTSACRSAQRSACITASQRSRNGHRDRAKRRNHMLAVHDNRALLHRLQTQPLRRRARTRHTLQLLCSSGPTRSSVAVAAEARSSPAPQTPALRFCCDGSVAAALPPRFQDVDRRLRCQRMRCARRVVQSHRCGSSGEARTCWPVARMHIRPGKPVLPCCLKLRQFGLVLRAVRVRRRLCIYIQPRQQCRSGGSGGQRLKELTAAHFGRDLLRPELLSKLTSRLR